MAMRRLFTLRSRAFGAAPRKRLVVCNARRNASGLALQAVPSRSGSWPVTIALLGAMGATACSWTSCKKGGDKDPVDESALQDYEQRLRRLTSIPRVFDAYASVEINGEKFMTAGDFLRAMLCYRYTRVDPRELRRRCGRYSHPLLGDGRGLIGAAEFSFLVELLAIPAGLFHVALAALDADGNGVVDRAEFSALTQRLLVPEATESDSSRESNGDAGGASAVAAKMPAATGAAAAPVPRASEKLSLAWFGEDGGRSVPAAVLESFARDLRRDVRMAELRLYSRMTPVPMPSGGDGAAGGGGWTSAAWRRLRGGSAGAAEAGGRPQVESLSTGDLALTLVSSCEPKRLPALLERSAGVRHKRKQVLVEDAFRLHDALESHAEELAYALSLYCRATGGGAGPDDLARAIHVVSGVTLAPELVDLLFDLFDEEGDGKLGVAELVDVLRTRNARRLGGRPHPPPGFRRFVDCVRSGGE
ncbi:unnamed protein product [Phaeothamnion confervicola]